MAKVSGDRIANICGPDKNGGEVMPSTWRTLKTVGVAAIALLIAGIPGAQSEAWKPTRNVEFVVPLAPGGGIDVATRHMQKIMQENGLVDTSMTVVNKPGAASALGYFYVSQQKANPHYITTGMSPLYTNALTGKHPLTYKDLTLICNLYAEHTVVYVREDSDIKDAKDLATKLKADPASVSFGLTALGAGHYFTLVKFMIANDLEPRAMKTVIFNSTGEAATAVRGGHINAVAGSAAGAVSQLKNGGVRVIGISAPTPVKEGALKGKPTWREQGFDVVNSNWRGIVGPPGLTREQIAYWEGIFEKLTQTKEWQELLSRNSWSDNFGRADEFKAFVAEQEKSDTDLFKRLGMIGK